MFLPYVSTTMRIFPLLTSLQRRAINLETKLNGKPVVFDIHPNEFIDESNEVRTIKKRSNNQINFLLKDLLRSKLKIKNLGSKAIPIYTKEIEFYRNRKYKFVTIKDYCKINRLL